MNPDHEFAEKSRALGDSFFREHDQELLDYLRSKAQESTLRAHLGEISGIHDPEVLEALVRAGITAESLTALMLLPLVRVAWADAKVQGSEREAILQAAHDEGVAKDSAAYRLLEKWLSNRPEAAVLEAWWEYAHALARELGDTSLAEIRRITLERARRVAEAAGGLLGLGNPISKSEELVLGDLARAFEKPLELK